MSVTTFPLFKELPAELQTMIWEMSLETEDKTRSRFNTFPAILCGTEGALGTISLLGRE